MRRLCFVLVLILVSASAATGVRLHALTECERWIAEYRDALAQSPTVQRANAARQRLHRYVHRKLVSTHSSPARILPARYRRPKMSREEALRKMEFACGGAELDDPPVAAFAALPTPTFVPAASEDGFVPVPPPSNLVAQNTPPGSGGGFPIGGVPGTPIYPGTGGGGNPPPPPVPPVPPAQTPEPGTLVLLATGLVGAAGVMRRRFTDAA